MTSNSNPPPYNPSHYLSDGSDVNVKSLNSKDPKNVHINTVAGAAVAGGVIVGAVAGSAVLGVAAAAGGAAMATRKGVRIFKEIHSLQKDLLSH